jgi:hypothetical protein
LRLCYAPFFDEAKLDENHRFPKRMQMKKVFYGKKKSVYARGNGNVLGGAYGTGYFF